MRKEHPMNHAEQAEKLLARYLEGSGSDQVAIAHALLAINESIQHTYASRGYDELALREMNQARRIRAALELANVWDSNEFGIPERQMLKIAADQLREVLR